MAMHLGYNLRHKLRYRHSLVAMHVRFKAVTGTNPVTGKGHTAYLINFVEDVYTGDVDSAAFYDIYQVINITVFFEMDISIVYSVL